MTGNARLALRELTVLAALGSLMFVLKAAMMAIPNIHPVAMLIIAGTLCFGWRMLYAVFVYVMLEGLIFGFGLWWVSYLYAWPLLVLVTELLPKNAGRLFWASVAGIHGLLFGLLCALPYLFIGGFNAALSYWLSGIPFDIIHCAGNFAATLALMQPVSKVLQVSMGE